MRVKILTIVASLCLAPLASADRQDTISWFEGKKRVTVENPPFTPSYETFRGPELENLKEALTVGMTITETAEIRQLQRTEAKETALEEGSRKALDAVLRDLLDQNITRNQWTLIEELFIDAAEAYVEEVETIEEDYTGRTATITMRVRFRTEMLLDVILSNRLRIATRHLPKMAVVVPVKRVGREFPKELPKVANSLEQEVAVAFQKIGFPVMSRRELRGPLKRDQHDALLFANDGEAARYVQEAGVEVFIRGACTIAEADAPRYLESSGMASIQSELTLHPLRVSDTLSLGTVQEEGRAIHISVETGSDKAVSAAFAKVREKLAGNVVKEWLLGEGSYAAMRLRIEALPRRTELVEWERTLPELVPQVQSTRRLSYEDAAAELQVLYNGSREALLMALEASGSLIVTGEGDGIVMATYVEEGS